MLYSFVGPGIDYGHRYDTCPNCGAEAHIHHLYLFGKGGDYFKTITEGVFCKFIQEQIGSACVHQWITIESYSGNFRSRRRGGSQDNYGYLRNLFVTETEAAYPCLRDFLEHKTEADPHFLRRLKAAIKADDNQKLDMFFFELHKEIKEWSKTNGR